MVGLVLIIGDVEYRTRWECGVHLFSVLRAYNVLIDALGDFRRMADERGNVSEAGVEGFPVRRCVFNYILVIHHQHYLYLQSLSAYAIV